MGKSGTKKAEAMIIDVQKTVEEGVARMAKGVDNFNAISQGNVKAIVKSSKIAAKAAETMGAEIAAFSQKAYEDILALAKDLAACTSPSEFIEKQTAYGKTSIEELVAEANKLNEIYASAAKEAVAPLNARFTCAVETVKDFRA